ncbi:hypothetical protein CYY_002453 [Polysphondylium violaceum]|uniref:WD40 repeat-containing protein n=1 Tax=Polysphondylium violaceum TaxID=133409 RepID=A0A8J4Q171_9MYCE|nr:hypothetical protein CYY_002453 [Polysphondylium violaceum]
MSSVKRLRETEINEEKDENKEIKLDENIKDIDPKFLQPTAKVNTDVEFQSNTATLKKNTPATTTTGGGGFKFNISSIKLGSQQPQTNDNSKNEEIQEIKRSQDYRETSVNVGPPRPASGNIGPSKPANIGPSKPSNIGPSKPANIGPPKPSTNKDEEDSSDSDDSDNDNSKVNNLGPPKPSTSNIGPPKPSTGNIGPPKPSTTKDDDSDSSDDSDSDSDSDLSDTDEEKEEINRWVELAKSLPITSEVLIKGHHRPVSTISLDPSGSRLLTGSYDCKVKFWDFNGMDSSLKSFREVEPNEGTQLRSIQFNLAGDMFLAMPYTTQIKLYDRDGFTKGETVSGDRYIQDLNHTKGHISTLTAGCWHPQEKEEFISSSIDGTVRLWDMNTLSKNKSVIKSRNNKGTRVAVSTCTYDYRGDVITAGGADGSISMWDKRSTLIKPKTTLEAHQDQSNVTSIQYNRDGIHMISRAMDHTLKVWDLRNTATPLAVWDDLMNDYMETDCIFGSFDRVIVTGTTAPKGGFGTIVMYDLASLSKMRQIRVDDNCSVLACAWNPRINQLFFGCSDGTTRVYYDAEKSVKGIKLCVAKAPRVKDPTDFEPERPILTPHSLPLFRQANAKKEEKRARNSKQTKKPEQPVTMTSTAKGPNLTQHLIKNTDLVNDTSWQQDARESFLAKADLEPKFFKNQPKTILDTSKQEDEEEQ